MNFVGMAPIPEDVPVVEVTTPNGVLDLHNDYLVEALGLDLKGRYLRISLYRVEERSRPDHTSNELARTVVLVVDGVRALELKGNVAFGRTPIGLDCLMVTKNGHGQTILDVRFDTRVSLAVAGATCSLQQGARHVLQMSSERAKPRGENI